MELNSIVVNHLGEELRGRKGQTSVQMGAEVDALALVRIGDSLAGAALPVAGGEEPLLLHVLEASLIEGAGDLESPEALFLRSYFRR